MHWRVLREGLAGGQVKYLDTDPSVCAGTVALLTKQVGDLVLYQMRDCRHITVASYRKSSKQMLPKKKNVLFRA